MKKTLLFAGLLFAGLSVNAQQVTTIAGSSTAGLGTSGGKISQAKFDSPYDMAIDSKGHIWISDMFNNYMVMLDPTNDKYYIRSGNLDGGYKDGFSIGVNGGVYYFPTGLAIGEGDSVYIADGLNNSIRRLDPFTMGSKIQEVRTVAGDLPTDGITTGKDGYVNGKGGTARFKSVAGIALSPDKSYLLVADQGNHVIRKVIIKGANYGTVSLFAGTPGSGGVVDGDMTAGAKFSSPESVAITAEGNVFVAELGGGVRLINTTTGKVSTVIKPNDVPEGARGLALHMGNLYVGAGCRIVKYNLQSGNATTYVGSEHPDSCGIANGMGRATRFDGITSLTISQDGNFIFVADQFNNQIRAVEILDQVSIDENSLESQFSVYPNPASSFIVINSNLDSRATIALTDMAGREVSQANVRFTTNTPHRIDLPERMKGVYILRITTDGKVLNKRIIIQ